VLTRATHLGFTSFGIADYDPRTYEASVRLAFREAPCGLCTNEVRTLGLRVVVRPAWRPHFVEVHRGSGRFVGPRSP
jgi:hypothetical protein